MSNRGGTASKKSKKGKKDWQSRNVCSRRVWQSEHKYKPSRCLSVSTPTQASMSSWSREHDRSTLVPTIIIQPRTWIHGRAQVEDPYLCQVLMVYKWPHEVKGTHKIKFWSWLSTCLAIYLWRCSSRTLLYFSLRDYLVLCMYNYTLASTRLQSLGTALGKGEGEGWTIFRLGCAVNSWCGLRSWHRRCVSLTCHPTASNTSRNGSGHLHHEASLPNRGQKRRKRPGFTQC